MESVPEFEDWSPSVPFVRSPTSKLAHSVTLRFREMYPGLLRL